MTVKSYRDLRVWNEGIDLAVAIYEATERFPKREVFGLTAQMRRAACSIPSNIAEGCSRQGTPELLRFLHVARGSLAELDTQILLSQRLGYLHPGTTGPLEARIEAVGKMLSGLISSLQPAGGRR